MKRPPVFFPTTLPCNVTKVLSSDHGSTGVSSAAGIFGLAALAAATSTATVVLWLWRRRTRDSRSRVDVRKPLTLVTTSRAAPEASSTASTRATSFLCRARVGGLTRVPQWSPWRASPMQPAPLVQRWEVNDASRRSGSRRLHSRAVSAAFVSVVISTGLSAAVHARRAHATLARVEALTCEATCVVLSPTSWYAKLQRTGQLRGAVNPSVQSPPFVAASSGGSLVSRDNDRGCEIGEERSKDPPRDCTCISVLVAVPVTLRFVTACRSTRPLERPVEVEVRVGHRGKEAEGRECRWHVERMVPDEVFAARDAEASPIRTPRGGHSSWATCATADHYARVLKTAFLAQLCLHHPHARHLPTETLAPLFAYTVSLPRAYTIFHRTVGLDAALVLAGTLAATIMTARVTSSQSQLMQELLASCAGVHERCTRPRGPASLTVKEGRSDLARGGNRFSTPLLAASAMDRYVAMLWKPCVWEDISASRPPRVATTDATIATVLLRCEWITPRVHSSGTRAGPSRGLPQWALVGRLREMCATWREDNAAACAIHADNTPYLPCVDHQVATETNDVVTIGRDARACTVVLIHVHQRESTSFLTRLGSFMDAEEDLASYDWLVHRRACPAYGTHVRQMEWV